MNYKIRPSIHLIAIAVFSILSTEIAARRIYWKIYKGVYSPGGVVEPTSYATANECQDKCTKNPLCTAVDYNGQKKECSLHFGTHIVVDAKVNEYSIGDSLANVQNWTHFYGYHAINAKLVDELTLIKCQKSCVDTTGCTSVVFMPFQRKERCHHHFGTGLVKDANVDQYISYCNKNEDDLNYVKNTTWIYHEHLSTPGGDWFEADNTFELCEKACHDIDFCTAFEFSPSAAKNCIIHFGTHLKVKITTSQYVLTTSPDGAVSWEMISGLHTVDGFTVSGFNTLEACQKKCIDMKICTAIDFKEAKENKCAIHLGNHIVKLQDGGQYIKKAVLYIAQHIKVTTNVNLIMYENIHSSGGVVKVESKTLEDCENACATENATAFDFTLSGDSHCFLHFDTHIRLNAIFLQMQLVRITVIKDVYFWYQYNGIYVKTNKPVAEVNTIESCQDKCVEDLSCTGIVFKHLEAVSCHHLYAEKIVESKGLTQYLIHKIDINLENKDFTTEELEKYKLLYWEEYFSVHTEGGVAEGNVATKEDCMKICLNKVGCTAIDFATDGSCSLHFGTELIADRNMDEYLVSVTSVNENIKDWQHFEGYYSDGSVAVENYQTVPKCQQSCLDTAGCTGIVFKYLKKIKCHHHIGGGLISNKDISQYVTYNNVKKESTDGNMILTSFTKYESLYTKIGILMKEFDFIQCKKSCNHLINCTAFTFQLNKCILHFKTEIIVDKAVNQYVLSKETNEWTVIEGMHSPFGRIVLGVETLDECKSKCAEIKTCTAIDFNEQTETKCFNHHGTHIIKENDAAQYVKTSLSIEITPITIHLNAIYTKYEKVITIGGVLSSGCDSFIKCQNECVNDNKCAAFDFSTDSSNKCMMHTDSHLNMQLEATEFELKINQGLTTWIQYNIIYSSGSKPIASVISLVDCLDLCLADKECTGVVFKSTDADKCSHHHHTGLIIDASLSQFVKNDVKGVVQEEEMIEDDNFENPDHDTHVTIIINIVFTADYSYAEKLSQCMLSVTVDF